MARAVARAGRAGPLVSEVVLGTAGGVPHDAHLGDTLSPTKLQQCRRASESGRHAAKFMGECQGLHK